MSQALSEPATHLVSFNPQDYPARLSNSPQDDHALIPATVNVSLHGRRDFAEVIELSV